MEHLSAPRIAVIGTGHLGKIHARLLAKREDARFSGVFDTNVEYAQVCATEHGVTAFSSVQEALDNSDAIIIATTTTAHYDVASAAVAAGKHCFIEKPITVYFEEAEKLIQQAQDANVLLQVGHVERFNPSLSALHGYDLRPKFIEAHRLSQFKPRATDVSVVLDLMIHDIDIALWMAGSPVVQIDANGVAVLTETIDIANARLTFQNGCVANLTASRISQKPMRKMRVFQENAYISIDFASSAVDIFRITDAGVQPPAGQDGGVLIGVHGQGENSKNIIFEQPPVPQLNAIEQEHFAFIRAIQGKREVAVSAVEAAEALRIAEEIVRKING